MAMATLIFAIFFAIFLRPTEQICPDSAGPFIVSILLALLFSLFHERAPQFFRAYCAGATTDQGAQRALELYVDHSVVWWFHERERRAKMRWMR
jgi:hypothetical protein